MFNKRRKNHLLSKRRGMNGREHHDIVLLSLFLTTYIGNKVDGKTIVHVLKPKRYAEWRTFCFLCGIARGEI